MTIGSIKSSLNSGDVGSLMEHNRLVRDLPEAVAPSPTTTETSSTGTFAEMLSKGMEKVNQAQTDADHAIKEAAAGRDKNLHETMLLIEKADMTYKFAMQVRNKILDAYREVMKMQV